MDMEIESGFNGDSTEANVSSLLAIARQHINQGNPSLALQAVHYQMETRDQPLNNNSSIQVHYQMETRDQPLNNNSSIQVVMAMKLCGGENAAMWTLHRGREMYQNRMQESSAAEELASLFAECAITESLPDMSARLLPSRDGDLSVSSLLKDTNETSILARSGRVQLVMDAFSDGSSFVCLQCGGLVSNLRKDEHFAYWCCAS